MAKFSHFIEKIVFWETLEAPREKRVHLREFVETSYMNLIRESCNALRNGLIDFTRNIACARLPDLSLPSESPTLLSPMAPSWNHYIAVMYERVKGDPSLDPMMPRGSSLSGGCVPDSCSSS